MKNKLIQILEGFGFVFEEGPEIESEENNFDLLNILSFLIALLIKSSGFDANFK